MEPGICKLCLQERELCNSHFISSSILGQLRDSSLDIPDPVVLTRKIAAQTSRHVTDYVFCQECEDLFNKHGEAWVIKNMARGDGTFQIYDALKRAKPLVAGSEMTVYCGARILEIDVEKLVYFAVGSFFKSAVHVWRIFGQPIDKTELGPYKEPIRKFLLGTERFPRNMCVLVGVWPSKRVYLATCTPRRGTESRFHTFTFYIPGIEFTLCVGKRIPPESIRLSTYPSPYRLLFVSMMTVRNALSSMHKLVAGARTSKGLEESLKQIAVTRRN